MAVNHRVRGSSPRWGANFIRPEQSGLFYGVFYLHTAKQVNQAILCGAHRDDLQKRVAQHNDPKYTLTTFTKKHRGPWKLVYFEMFETRAVAMKREREIKAKKSRLYIEELIKRSGC